MSESTPNSPTDSGPLDPDQKRALQASRMLRDQAIRGPSRVAAINGWSLVVFGGLSLLLSLGNLTGFLVGAAILALGWNELQGRERLLALDPAGPARLVKNQFALMAVAGLYTFGKAWMASRSPDPYLSELETLLDLPAGELGGTLAVAYLVAGVGALLAFGLTARYYSSRADRLGEYLRTTPDWIVELQRSSR